MNAEYTFLVADGNRVSRRTYSQLLKRHFKASRVLEVELGEDALYICNREPINCILLDNQLPDMDCMGLMEKLARSQYVGFVPVVVLSEEGQEHSIVAAMKAGAQDYLVKGHFSHDLLGQTILSAMEKVKLHQTLEHKHRDLEKINSTLTREILERKKAEQSLRLFRDLINQTVDALFIASPFDGSILDHNDAAAENLGYTNDEFAKLYLKNFDQHIRDMRRDVMEAMDGDSLTYETHYQQKGGSLIPMEVTFKHITHSDNRYLVGVARDITVRKKVEAQLRDLSNRDGLTGVYNRRYFNEQMVAEWQRLRREAQPLTLIMLDVDFFKFFNDHYGHGGGDECLKQVAQTISSHVKRPADVMARYGGEEFAVILPMTNRAGGRTVAETLRAAVENLNMPHVKAPMKQVTVSVGMATVVPDSRHTIKDLIELADQALYEAKDKGRNRVVARVF